MIAKVVNVLDWIRIDRQMNFLAHKLANKARISRIPHPTEGTLSTPVVPD